MFHFNSACSFSYRIVNNRKDLMDVSKRNRLNTQENDKNSPVNNKINNSDDGEIRLFPEVNSLTVSGRKVETIENSGPIFAVSSITGHRIVDMEIFAAVTYMLGFTFCKHWYSFAGRL